MWVTAVLDFVRYIGTSGGLEDSVLSVFHRLRPRTCLVCDFGTKSREEGRKVTESYIYHFFSLAVEAGFYGDTGRVIGFFTKLSNVYHG